MAIWLTAARGRIAGTKPWELPAALPVEPLRESNSVGDVELFVEANRIFEVGYKRGSTSLGTNATLWKEDSQELVAVLAMD